MRIYTSDWDEIATFVKEQAGWHCENCGHGHDPRHGYTLTVHHIDLNSLNNHPGNLVALCQKCHLHYQRPLHLLQLSYFPLAPWQKRLLDALGTKSRRLLEKSHTKLPG